MKIKLTLGLGLIFLTSSMVVAEEARAPARHREDNLLMRSLNERELETKWVPEERKRVTISKNGTASEVVLKEGKTKELEIKKLSSDGYAAVIIDGESLPAESNVRECDVWVAARTTDAAENKPHMLKVGDKVSFKAPQRLTVLSRTVTKENLSLMTFHNGEAADASKIRTINCYPKDASKSVDLTLGDLSRALGLEIDSVEKLRSPQYRRTGDEKFLLENPRQLKESDARHI